MSAAAAGRRCISRVLQLPPFARVREFALFPADRFPAVPAHRFGRIVERAPEIINQPGARTHGPWLRFMRAYLPGSGRGAHAARPPAVSWRAGCCRSPAPDGTVSRAGSLPGRAARRAARPPRAAFQPVSRPAPLRDRRPSPALARDSAAAARRPRGAAPATRCPSMPPSVPAAPSSLSGARTSGKASVPSQACDAAIDTASTAGKPAGQPLMRGSGTLQDRLMSATTPSGIIAIRATRRGDLRGHGGARPRHGQAELTTIMRDWLDVDLDGLAGQGGLHGRASGRGQGPPGHVRRRLAPLPWPYAAALLDPWTPIAYICTL